MNLQLAIELAKGLGLAILVGLGFFIIPFGVFLLIRMLPWFIWGLLIKSDSDRDRSEPPNYPFGDSKYDKQVYIDECRPSQVIKRLKRDGLQSLFRDYSSTASPVQQPSTLCNQDTPVDFIQSTNPVPIQDKFQDMASNAPHADNLLQEDKECQPKENDTILLANQ